MFHMRVDVKIREGTDRDKLAAHLKTIGAELVLEGDAPYVTGPQFILYEIERRPSYGLTPDWSTLKQQPRKAEETP